MKKSLSILLSILIIALSFTFLAGAAGCDCANHKNTGDCSCCFDCDSFSEAYLTACIKNTAYKDENGNIKYDYETRCCDECRGLIPCHCGCEECCGPADGSENGDADGNGQILTPDQQDQVIDGFQAVLGRIREFFDKLFNAIFEFLRFDEIMGNN